MADGPRAKSTEETSSAAWLWLVVVLAVLVVAPVLLLGAGLFWVLRRYVTRLQFGLIAGVSAFALLAAAGAHAGTYLGWLAGVVSGDGRFDFPYATIVAGAGLIAGVLGLAVGSAFGNKLPSFLRREAIGRQDFLPSTKQRQRLDRVITPPVEGSSKTVLPPAEIDGKPGRRSFPVGLNEYGKPVMLSEAEVGTHGMIFGATGSGKALALDTPIPTPTGWTTMGDVAAGDVVFDETGKPCNVVFSTEVQHGRRCFEVRFDDGSTIVADGDHRWYTWTRAARVSEQRHHRNEHSRRRADGRDQRHLRQVPSVVTTDEIAASLNTPSGHTNHSIAVTAPLHLPNTKLPLDPYVLGAWLGDGSSRNGMFTSADPQIVNRIRSAGFDVKSCTGRYVYSIRGIMPALRELGVLTPSARDRQATRPRVVHNISAHKHIPDVYLRASFEQRLELLRGLMDTDGYAARSGSCEFSASNERLADDVYELVCSLGIKATHRSKIAKLYGKEHKVTHVIGFSTALDVFGLDRKRQRQNTDVRRTQTHRYIVAVTPVESVPVRCIQVDSPNHLYLAGPSMVPTHNTETIKAIAAGLGDLGWDGIILDLKEDTKPGGLRDWVHDYANYHNVPYQELRLSSPDPDYWFDVLSGLARDEGRDAIMSLTSFDDDYYQQICKKLMGQLLKLMYAAHEIDPVNCTHPNLFDISKILAAPKLQNSTKKLRAIVATKFDPSDFEMLESPSQVEQQQAHSWGAKIGQVFETQAGAVVLRPSDRRQMFDVTRPGLMYIGLDSQGKQDLTKLVSSAVLQRLSADSAARTVGGSDGPVRPKFIIVDEANWVDRKIVQNLLSRARSAGIVMFLATQGPRDWIDKDGDDFGRLGQNVNVTIVMRQGDPDSAEMCAQYIGTQNFYEQTLTHRDGDLLNSGSVRRESDYRVTPEELRELRVGEAIIRIGTPTARLSFAKIVMRDPTMPVPGRKQLTSTEGLTDAVDPTDMTPSSGIAAPPPPI